MFELEWDAGLDDAQLAAVAHTDRIRAAVRASAADASHRDSPRPATGGAARPISPRQLEVLAERDDVIGVYVYGSLVTGDYSPAASDINVVVLVRREPDEAVTRELDRLPGVREVRVDLASGAVTVASDATLPVEDVRGAVDGT